MFVANINLTRIQLNIDHSLGYWVHDMSMSEMAFLDLSHYH